METNHSKHIKEIIFKQPKAKSNRNKTKTCGICHKTESANWAYHWKTSHPGQVPFEAIASSDPSLHQMSTSQNASLSFNEELVPPQDQTSITLVEEGEAEFSSVFENTHDNVKLYKPYWHIEKVHIKKRDSKALEKTTMAHKGKTLGKLPQNIVLTGDMDLHRALLPLYLHSIGKKVAVTVSRKTELLIKGTKHRRWKEVQQHLNFKLAEKFKTRSVPINKIYETYPKYSQFITSVLSHLEIKGDGEIYSVCFKEGSDLRLPRHPMCFLINIFGYETLRDSRDWSSFSKYGLPLNRRVGIYYKAVIDASLEEIRYLGFVKRNATGKVFGNLYKEPGFTTQELNLLKQQLPEHIDAETLAKAVNVEEERPKKDIRDFFKQRLPKAVPPKAFKALKKAVFKAMEPSPKDIVFLQRVREAWLRDAPSHISLPSECEELGFVE